MVPTPEAKTLEIQAIKDTFRFTLPLRRNFTVAATMPVPLTTLLVPTARWVGMPAIR